MVGFINIWWQVWTMYFGIINGLIPTNVCSCVSYGWYIVNLIQGQTDRKWLVTHDGLFSTINNFYATAGPSCWLLPR
jgi:hypothetical protein